MPHLSPAAPPLRITVPGRFTAPVQAVAADADGSLRLPASPYRLGWWALGALPGAAHGTVLVAGHVDSRHAGAGPLAGLREVPLGSRVHITAADGSRHSYRITARRTYRKDALPQDLFGTEGPARLALVTCTGRYQPAGGYEENLVLYGLPTQG